MRKAMTVILWLGLMVCAVMLISLSGQKYALRREVESETRKKQVLQNLYDQLKEEWTEKETALTQEKDALLRETKTLTLERDALTQALKAAQEETQAQRQTADWLTAERETASDRLSEVLTMLLTPVPELPDGEPEAEEETPTPALPLPGGSVKSVPLMK